MRKLKNKFRWRNVLFVALFIKLIYWLFRWCGPSKGKKGYKIDDKLEANAIPGQLIIMRKKEITQEQFDRWKQEKLGSLGIRYKRVCGKCDNMLELWEGDESDVRTFIQEVEKVSPGGQSQGSGVEGGGETPFAYFCRNFKVDTPERFLEPCIRDQYKYDEGRIVPLEPARGALVTIGVLDTGLSDDAKNVYTKPTTGSCMEGGTEGWNFVDDNDDTTDNNDSKHGSIVTELIAGQAREYRKHPINILPVKTHDKDGQSTLFDILCAIAYASSCGVQIINASFGFYAKQKADAPSLLRAFVERYLVAKNILLIAAAGNINSAEDSDFLAHATDPVGHPRNLDVHPFYPACFASEFEQVLAVTTVHITSRSASSSPEQNFSPHIVDMGVECEQVDLFGHFSFKHPFKPAVLIYGTSYAAPILTGIISQHYTELLKAMPGGQFDKQILLQQLQKLLIAKAAPKLNTFVKDGIYCKKDPPL